MKTLLLLLAGCAGHFSFNGGSTSTTTSSSPSSPSESHGDTAGAYERFAIQGNKLGVPLESQAGFTCGPPRGTDGFTTQNHGCVKFTDARCEGRKTEIHHIRSSGDLPKGQTCFMDEFTGGTYLDRTFMSPVLTSMHLIGTDSNNPKVFQIVYTFAADDLTPDSKLGKMLIAKYGEPTYKNPPIQMSWTQGDVQLSASCRSTVGPQGEYCTITVEDDALDRAEREHQRVAEEAARKQNAPPPPSL